MSSSRNQFRIIVGSYEHNILCVSLDLTNKNSPVFIPIFHFQAHSLSVKCLDSGKRYLVSGSNDEHIRIYDLQKRKELGTLLSHQGSITALKFSRSVAQQEPEESAQQTGDSKASVVKLSEKAKKRSADGKWLLSASDDQTITVWRVKDWEKFGVLKGHTKKINDLDIHSSNRIAISVSDDHSIRLWNLMSMKKSGVLKLRNYNQNGQFIRWLGDQHFVVALNDKVLIYEISSAKVIKEIEIENKKVIMHLEVCELDGEKYIVVGLNDGKVVFYDSNFLNNPSDENEGKESEEEDDVKPEFTLLGHSNRIKDFKFYSNSFGNYLVTVSSDGRIVVWDMASKEQVAVYDCAERLNCVTVIDENVEKFDSMKKRDQEEADVNNGEQSEVEADPQELKKIMLGKTKSKKNKKNNNNKRRKVEVEIEN
ncbi:hypothetical protein ACO0RG_003830 [Hanseniaspora osmophila]